MFHLYSLLYSIALLFFFPREYFKRKPELRRTWLKEKFGYIDLDPNKNTDSKTIWVHAVSVGEVIAAATFIKAYKELKPDHKIIVSTITDTGRAVAGDKLKGLADVIYLPFDLKGPISRGVEIIKPDILVIMETEIWPNLIKLTSDKGVPVVIINGRISDSSFQNYLKIKGMLSKVFPSVTKFCMQDDSYASKIRALGVEDEKITVTGNFKFDLSLKDSLPAWTSQLKGPVIVAGSTHRGEDEMVLKAYIELRKKYDGLNLVIAPRHPQRFKEVWTLIENQSVYCIKRSEIADNGLITGAVILLDTVGELSGVYGSADIVVIGGSFIPHGGQNPLEPAWWGKPVLCGPHMNNFPFINDFFAQDAAMQTSEGSLVNDIDSLLSSKDKMLNMGERAREILRANRGSVKKALDIVEDLISGG
jgi:3-deoxy-D-manno-octulosonic-acid transferase